jgi:transcriptional regulator with XRE-family HTH domain
MNTNYRKWSDIRADRTDLTDEGLAKARRQMLAERAAYALAEIRKQAGLTQTDVAEAMGVSQNRVSVIERGDIAHTELETIRSYIEALGGHVRVVADFAGHSVDIRGWDQDTPKRRRRRNQANKRRTRDRPDMGSAARVGDI